MKGSVLFKVSLQFVCTVFRVVVATSSTHTCQAYLWPSCYKLHPCLLGLPVAQLLQAPPMHARPSYLWPSCYKPCLPGLPVAQLLQAPPMPARPTCGPVATGSTYACQAYLWPSCYKLHPCLPGLPVAQLLQAPPMAYLCLVDRGHVTQSTNTVHSNNIVSIHLSTEEIVHDLLCQCRVLFLH